MNSALPALASTQGPPASNHELIAVLAGMVRRRRPGTHIVELRRAPAAYISSWWLEELSVRLDDGSVLPVMFKDLGREAPGSGAHSVKPVRLSDPARESWVYRTVLERRCLGAPELLGTVSDATRGLHWLFLERVNGTPLAEIGDPEVWCSVARWLGRFHTDIRTDLSLGGPLLRHDEPYHRWWFQRALAAARSSAMGPAHAPERSHWALDVLQRIEPLHRLAVKEALRLGATLIHGEFYPSNILVETRGGVPHVRPVDWEMAAVGPGLFDLAALAAGRLPPEMRDDVLCAYRDAVLEADGACPERDVFHRGVVACRLLLAIQWQGWGWGWGWQPPPEHRYDWLEEAALCAAELAQ